MAQLPDLDTGLIGLLAYHNFGVPITKAPYLASMYSFTEYDNGIDGVLSLRLDGATDNLSNTVVVPTRVRVRIRTDGVILAYMLRADEVADGAATTAYLSSPAGTRPYVNRGLLSVHDNGGYGANAMRVNTTTILAAALKVIDNLTTAGGKLVVTETTVKHYDYEYPTATAAYLLGEATNGTFTFTQPVAGNTILGIYAAGVNGPGAASITLSINASVVATSGTSGDNRRHNTRLSAAQRAACLNAPGTSNSFIITNGSVTVVQYLFILCLEV